MGINIFDIKPNVVSRDLSGKSFLIYGEKKCGKTTIASKFPKALVMAFEKGYNFIPGIVAQPINKWSEALEVKKALLKDAETAEKKEAETYYKTVVVDTGDIAYDLCEKYIVDKEGVEYLDETEMKRGYKATSREFDRFFQEIVKAGYTLIVISHATTKQVKENGQKFDKTIPTMSDRGLLVISRLVDVIGYATKETDDETGKTTHTLTLKGSKYLEAGSRNPYLPDKIPLTYEALADAMKEAIDQIEQNGGKVVDSGLNPFRDVTEDFDFKEIMQSIKECAKLMAVAGKKDDYFNIVEQYLGRGRNVKDCTNAQIDQMTLILQDLRDYIAENGLGQNKKEEDTTEKTTTEKTTTEEETE